MLIHCLTRGLWSAEFGHLVLLATDTRCPVQDIFDDIRTTRELSAQNRTLIELIVCFMPTIVGPHLEKRMHGPRDRPSTEGSGLECSDS
jgi:hypothetical protein